MVKDFSIAGYHIYPARHYRTSNKKAVMLCNLHLVVHNITHSFILSSMNNRFLVDVGSTCIYRNCSAHHQHNHNPFKVCS